MAPSASALSCSTPDPSRSGWSSLRPQLDLQSALLSEDAAGDARAVAELLNAALEGDLPRAKKLTKELRKAGKGVAEAVADAVGMPESKRRGPLHLAAATGKVEMCKFLIRTCEVDVNATDVDGATPLIFAIQGMGSTAVVKLLLSYEADPNKADSGGIAPLHIAAERDSYEVAELLLSKGAKVDPICESGEAPLHVAAAYGNARVLKLLLEHNADEKVQSVPREQPMTAPQLHDPPRSGHPSNISSGGMGIALDDDIGIPEYSEYDDSEVANLFVKVNSKELKAILSKYKIDATGNKEEVWRRANKELKLEELKQRELRLLCAANDIHQNKDTNAEMISKLKNHKKSLLLAMRRQKFMIELREHNKQLRISLNNELDTNLSELDAFSMLVELKEYFLKEHASLELSYRFEEKECASLEKQLKIEETEKRAYLRKESLPTKCKEKAEYEEKLLLEDRQKRLKLVLAEKKVQEELSKKIEDEIAVLTEKKVRTNCPKR
ncbi:uncharacterized protein LOC133883588 isoform X1 [Phragmites australis]|uniref:uncharacterized protein LOC133883588 isoform X1 n=1 Tax=Phragmites australis TaxID=29695 RepID=UPI002D77DE8E|nr:uncharacterized protein LOC133883588 isoform X1 [Phragmites australis]XP_062178938.1 uncharacterized protein LOC133883588 isoform X1 [Phragmites australis]XP_062178939.1 uncharacterized protein LOC133883588 isoform X1 [Phragmites australis]XP_062178940.1 uncharacterized protein LOC133883588 isoform X1 [Phragmites australis]XP_062178941.1 uncharacterized protein LOC133883588 isoform X1 [Phragmites australis]XP_062178942.1 uncharacterized protein LOC133883588 isoform X1 [Phragmites australis]